METDAFANNRLSLILHSENPIRPMISLQVEGPKKGNYVLYETLKDPKAAYSEEPEHSPMMYAHKREGFNGTFYDLMQREVREPSIYVCTVNLCHTVFQQAQREVRYTAL